MSPKEGELHRCEMCRPRGHLKFPRGNMKDAKRLGRSSKLVCTDCRAADAEADKMRAALSHPDVWQCTCPGAAKKRVHDHSNQRCRLYLGQAGQRRWLGETTALAKLIGSL